MPAPYPERRRHLGQRLRELRQHAELSGTRLAQRLGWVQSKVSKIETGRQLPTEVDLRAWAEAVESPGAADELLALLEQARVEYLAFQGAPLGELNVEWQRLEAEAGQVDDFQPAMIPGLLQTAEYAREMLHLPNGPMAFGSDEADIDRIVGTRLQRQQMLYQPGKRFRIVLLEAALTSRLCSPGALAGQLDRLLAVIGLPALELGIVPADAPLPVAPLSGFILVDDEFVLIETLTGNQELSDPEEVRHYRRAFELLREAALRGRQAVPLIHRALDRLHQDVENNS